jgi:hypothetical protein
MNFKKKNNKFIKINLLPDEQMTINHLHSSYDIAKKKWGFYVTPSFQNRCKKNNLLPALIIKNNKIYFILVNKKKINYFMNFLKSKNYSLLKWLNTNFYFKKYFIRHN